MYVWVDVCIGVCAKDDRQTNECDTCRDYVPPRSDGDCIPDTEYMKCSVVCVRMSMLLCCCVVSDTSTSAFDFDMCEPLGDAPRNVQVALFFRIFRIYQDSGSFDSQASARMVMRRSIFSLNG